VRGGRSRASFAPQRMLSPALLAACDAWAAEVVTGEDALVIARRHAIWMLYRYAGARLVEFVWSDAVQLPKLEVDDNGHWTLHVLGRGNKTRAILLPARCVPVLSTYRQLRGLPSQPAPFEHAALIHGLKGGSLQSSGLYDEVKAIFVAAAKRRERSDPPARRACAKPRRTGCATPTRACSSLTIRCRCRPRRRCWVTLRCRIPAGADAVELAGVKAQRRIHHEIGTGSCRVDKCGELWILLGKPICQAPRHPLRSYAAAMSRRPLVKQVERPLACSADRTDDHRNWPD
jgi:hypothetical protein